MMTSIDKFQVSNSFGMRTFKFCCSQRRLDWLRVQNLHMHVIHLEIRTHQSPNLPTGLLLSLGLFHLCIRFLDEHVPKYVLCIRTPVGWNWQKCEFSLFWDISGVSEKYLELGQELVKSMVELVFVDNLRKLDSKHYSRVIDNLQKLIKNFVRWREYGGASRPSCLLFLLPQAWSSVSLR